YLKGVDHDLKNYKEYLTSNVGGAWYGNDYSTSEIQILKNEKKDVIISAIKNSNADFTFVVFTGHGFLYSKNDLTYICLSDGYLSEHDLITSAKRRVLILDCCRESEDMSESFLGDGGKISKSRDSLSFYSNSKVLEINTSRSVIHSRAKFDLALQLSNEGQFTGYACLIDQTSGDNPTSGGAFSSELINTGKNFGSIDRKDFWLPIRRAVNETIKTLKDDIFTDQIPTYITTPINMDLTHPFAITNMLNII
ncbi:MAG: caspase family protein, partial [Bacteroidales bacterium]|nr:caspase family protein [Bacteroidales bacterium]